MAGTQFLIALQSPVGKNDRGGKAHWCISQITVFKSFRKVGFQPQRPFISFWVRIDRVVGLRLVKWVFSFVLDPPSRITITTKDGDIV